MKKRKMTVSLLNKKQFWTTQKTEANQTTPKKRQQ